MKTLLTLLASATTLLAAEKPNIIFLITDDQDEYLPSARGFTEMFIHGGGGILHRPLAAEEAKTYLAANPQLRRKKQADPDDKAIEESQTIEEDGDEGVSEAVVKPYEARDFNNSST